jgi:bacillopeptidase F (M6 metalloprotease family)
MTLTQPIDLTDVVFASLNFWAKWDIEAGYDFVQVLISDNNGATWNPVSGNYSHPGNSNQAEGEPLYDGTQNTWVREEISLASFVGKQIKIRFVLVSDQYVTGDGFFWDDMTVTVIDVATGINDQKNNPADDRITLYPNPATRSVTMKFNVEDIPAGSTKVKLYNSLGKIIYAKDLESGKTELVLDISSWVPGIYFWSVDIDQAMIKTGKLIVR